MATHVTLTTLYAQMETAGIPEPILDTIAHQVHRLCFNDGLKAALEDPRTPFECSCDQDISLEEMLDMHRVEVFIDSWYDWLTVVFYMPASNTYILYYHYEECYDNTSYLMEIAIENDTVFRLVRFYGVPSRGQPYTTFNICQASGGIDWIPFQFLAKIAGMKECTNPTRDLFQFRDDTCREWRSPTTTLAWFSKKERLFDNMAKRS